MALEITGKFLKNLPMTSGSTDRGTWSKQPFIIETLDQYPRKIHILAWNDRVNEVAGLKEGDVVKITFSLDSREYNERWYTDVRATRIERLAATSSANAGITEAVEVEDANVQELPSTPATEDPFATQQVVDDLPF